jgi:tetratricopeptide (TPR) repeat protein
MLTVLTLLGWLLVATGAPGQAQTPPAGVAATAPPGMCSDGDDHSWQIEPFALAPGRPAWAPLELSWGDSQYRLPLERVLREGPPVDQARAALGLALIGAQQSREALAAALTSNQHEVRQWAGIALCYLGDPRGLSFARQALNSAPTWIRYYALVGLWRLDSAEVRDFVAKSHSTQGPFLTALLPQALASAPWLPATRLSPPRDTSSAPAVELWTEFAGQMDLATDYWWHAGDYDQCCEVMQTGIFFTPQRVDLYDNTAWLQWSLGRDAVALELLNRCLECNPDDWRAQFNLGLHLFNTKRYAQALPHLQVASSGCCTWCEPTHLYAHALEYLKRPHEALPVWEECMRRFPNDTVGQRNLDRVRQKQKDSH